MKEVFGLFTNNGDGKELLYHLGLFENEDEAIDFCAAHFPSDVWVEIINVK